MMTSVPSRSWFSASFSVTNLCRGSNSFLYRFIAPLSFSSIPPDLEMMQHGLSYAWTIRLKHISEPRRRNRPLYGLIK